MTNMMRKKAVVHLAKMEMGEMKPTKIPLHVPNRELCFVYASIDIVKDAFTNGHPVSAIVPKGSPRSVLFVLLKQNNMAGGNRSRVLTISLCNSNVRSFQSLVYREWIVKNNEHSMEIATTWDYAFMLPEPKPHYGEIQTNNHVSNEWHWNVPYFY